MEFSRQEYWTGLPFPSLVSADTQAEPHSTASPAFSCRKAEVGGPWALGQGFPGMNKSALSPWEMQDMQEMWV